MMIKVLLLMVLLSGVLGARPALFFTSLTSLGWQVYVMDLENGESRQVSQGAGDKRTPKYSAQRDQIIVRGPKGDIVSYDAKGEQETLLDLVNCADIAVVSGTGKLLLTRLTTGNPQRQQIWKAGPGYPTRETTRLTALSKGSLRQVQPSQTAGLYLASHLWRFGEERIILLREPVEGELIFESEALSPEMEISAYPSWLGGEEWVCSHRVSSKNYDLYEGVLGREGMEPLLETEDYSEFGSSYDEQTNRLYFERLDKEGFWSLAWMDVETKEVHAIQTVSEAKEPYFVNLPETWFYEN